VFQTLGRYTSPAFDVVIDGVRRSSRNLLIAVGNGRSAGGGFFLTPDASVDDGLLDVCVIEKVSVPQILRLMPRVLRGRHQGVSQVSFHRGRTISITSPEPFFVHADGEIVGRGVNNVSLGLARHRLPIIVEE
jgi:diacylglycerol kinase family enzyme